MELLKPTEIVAKSKIEETTKEMVKEIKNDAEVYALIKKLNIDDATLIKNIAVIDSFKEDYDYCRHCPGLENCNKQHPHHLFNLINDGSNWLKRELVPCSKKIEDNKRNSSYVIRDFPSSWRNANIPNMDKSKVRMKLIQKYENSLNTHDWIYIIGSHRSGKSYVAASILNSYIALTHKKAAFLNYPARVRELNDLSYNDKDLFIKFIEMYSTIPLLVLDDFGNEYKNEYIRDSITLSILNERAHNGLITIFTSSFLYNDIMSMYTINSAGFARGKQLKNLLEQLAGDPIDISSVSIY